MYFFYDCVKYLFIAPIGQNIAYKKSTEQFPDNFGNGTSDKAVDGHKQYTYAADLCAHTNWYTWTTEAWWRVDLGDTYRLTGVKIHNRNEARMFVL